MQPSFTCKSYETFQSNFNVDRSNEPCRIETGLGMDLESEGWASTNRDRPWLEGQAFIEGWTYEVRDRP